MLNIIWGLMIVCSVVYASLTGNLGAVGNGMMDSAKEAVTLGIGMIGVVAMWSGLMEIAKESGLLKSVTKLLYPFVRFLFPKVPEGDEAMEHITVNIISNIFGLGAAATPAGLKAMKALEKLEEKRKRDLTRASNEMCTFLVINISSLQLIPVNMIAFRGQYGSPNPMAVVGPAIIATLISTAVAVIFCKICSRWKEG